MNSEIRFKLTEEQIEKLKPLYDRAETSCDKGTPGMILAQCTSYYELKAAFIDEERALKVCEVVGTQVTQGKAAA